MANPGAERVRSRSLLVLGIALVAALLVVSCGGGGGDGKTRSRTWNEMIWNEGVWGP